MRVRVTLRSPFGDEVTRDVEDGRWSEPSGQADLHLGRDSWALPGLSDSHAHLAGETLTDLGDVAGARERAREALTAGVTLILDKGWRDAITIEAVTGMADAERPDIEAAAAIISVPEGYFPSFGVEVEPDAIAATVLSEARRGLGWVKLVGDWPRPGRGPVANFDEGQLREAVTVAEAVGARVAIHTMAREVPGVAVRAGIHSIEHGLFLAEADLGQLGARGGMWVPTILRVEETIRQLGEGSSGGKLLADGLANVHQLLPAAVEAGVRVLTGTDLVGSPAGVAAEALKLAEYDLAPRAVVEAVGGAAFEATGRPVDFRPGAPANAVLFPADPLTDLAVLGNPTHVIRLGVVR